MKKYRKTIAAFGGFLGVAGAALADGSLDSTEASGLVIAAAGVLAVYLFPNALPAAGGSE
jgi:hypothetical protein